MAVARRGFVLSALLALAGCNNQDSADSRLADQAAESRSGAADVLTRPYGELDSESGLVIDANWELVRAHCGACHSTRLITQNRGDRETWLSLIRWMQESQGLWEFDPATESGILDYLAANYAPPAAGRRPALDESLLPPNPYTE